MEGGGGEEAGAGQQGKPVAMAGGGTRDRGGSGSGEGLGDDARVRVREGVSFFQTKRGVREKGLPSDLDLERSIRRR